MSDEMSITPDDETAAEAAGGRGMAAGGGDLHKRTVRGAGWFFGMKAFRQVLELIRLGVLARLLTKADFGLLGTALLTMGILDTFTKLGFGAAIIHRKELDRQYLDTAWTAVLVRGCGVGVLMFFAAPLAGIFFKNPESVNLVRALSGVMVLRGLSNNPAVVLFQKELQFNKQFVYQVSGAIADAAVSITAAYFLRNVWALVIGILSGEAVRCLSSYVLSDYRPRVVLVWRKVRDLFSYGKWVLGSQILTFLLSQGDDIFVGRILGVGWLGLYQMAYRWSNLPATEISGVISQVMFPAYSKIQSDRRKVGEVYRKVFSLTSLLIMPVSAVLYILAEEFTYVFLGAKWVDMVPAMRILAIYGMFRSLGATTGVVFMGIGKPKISTYLKSVQTVMLMSIIWPMTVRWGIVGTSWAVTGVVGVTVAAAIYMVLRETGLRVFDAVRAAAVPTVSAIVMGGCLYWLKVSCLDGRTVLGFAGLCAAGAAVYAAATGVFGFFNGFAEFKLTAEQVRAFLGRGRGEESGA